jgi:hypothetical protein
MPLSTSRVFAVAPLPLGWHVKFRADMRQAWSVYLGDSLTAQWPDERLQAAFDANKEHLMLAWTGNSVMRGPLAMPGFRFREAAYVTHALDALGLHLEAQHVLRPYLTRLKGDGRFDDGTGEPAANGQALWSLWQHYHLTGDDEFARQMAPVMHAGAAWILKRRRAGRLPAAPEPGECATWDDLWSAAGLRAAAEMVRAGGGDPAPYEQGFREYWAALERAWAAAPPRRLDGGRLDALVALAPLRLLPPDDARLAGTLEALRAAGFREGAFFDEARGAFDMAVAMRIAQCYVLQRSREAWPIVDWLLRQASGTWAWPEYIHPDTRDGAAGEGHPSLTTAAWLTLMRSLLLFEEGGRLVFTPALPPEWVRPGAVVAVHQAPTAFGRVDYTLAFGERCATLAVAGRWRVAPEEIELNLPVPATGLRAPGGRVEAAGADAVRVFAPATLGELRVEW